MAQYSKQEQQASRGGAGCWLTAIVSIFTAMVLAIVSLFLPPFNLYETLFTEPYIELAAAGDATSSADGGFSIAAATNVQDEFGVIIESVSLQNFEAGNASAGDWVAGARAQVPPTLALQSPVYNIRTKGTAPDAVLLSLSTPNDANLDLLDMYGWFANSVGLGGEWRFIPSSSNGNRVEIVTDEVPQHLALFQAAPDTPEVLVSYDVSRALSLEVANAASIVAPAGLQPAVDGSISGSLAAGFSTSADYLVMPIIRDFVDPRALDTQTVDVIISNPAIRDEHITRLTQIAAGGYDGIVIDYRGFSAEQRDNFTTFIRDLDASLDSVGRSLALVVPAAENVDGVWDTGGYDWRALGMAVDHFQINLGINPQNFAQGQNQYLDALLTWAVGEVDRYKLLLGLSAQSIREIAGNYSSIGYNEALAGLGNVQVEAANVSETGTIQPGSEIRASLDGRQAVGTVDPNTNIPYLDYVDADGNTTARMWLTTGNALRQRMDTTVPFALGGVAFEDLLMTDRASDILQSINEYSERIPAVPVTSDWSLRWRIVGSDGEIFQEYTTDLGEDLVVTLEAPDSNYAVNLAVVLNQEGREAESVRSGAQIALFSPTATPTPLPTSTPTPIPTQTPTPPPVVATNPPAQAGSGGGEVAVNPVAAGRINLGGFEYGGHVTSAGSTVAINAMRSAGMTWLKVQIRYYPGSSPAVAAADIQAAKANGFKILIGTVGNPADLGNGGDAYIQQYANWLGGIAALGPDAIEVWNEPNIDREWPRDQISGAAYTNMLRQGYQAIKRANPSVIVISAAPAPTGAEAAFPGQVVNDDRFLRDMVNAGALNYMDCVGVHYNEGATPPTVTSGDPRDNFYTRYYQTMVNTYWNITGGARQLCFTELGYLSPEGFGGSLPGNFQFGNNTSVAEQAAWLAQAAALSSNSGRVRMMIVWNVDFTVYGADPQAGYAIVRPGGGCPACAALAGAR